MMAVVGSFSGGGDEVAEGGVDAASDEGELGCCLIVALGFGLEPLPKSIFQKLMNRFGLYLLLLMGLRRVSMRFSWLLLRLTWGVKNIASGREARPSPCV